MKVYSLLGFLDYEGSELVGVFGDLQSITDCVESGNKDWHYDQMGYVESELGEQIEDVLEVVEYVEFERYSYKVVDKL
jgi:hypothetical protein